MKKTTNNSASVVISTATAEAICKLLYSERVGVPMDPIIEDLGGSIQVKLNVGLIMKGLKPEVDKSPRVYGYGDPDYRHRFVRYEMLTDRVFYVAEYRNSDGTWSDCAQEHPETMSLQEWEDKDTWYDLFGVDKTE